MTLVEQDRVCAKARSKQSVKRFLFGVIEQDNRTFALERGL
jgi:hypothetical protein